MKNRGYNETHAKTEEKLKKKRETDLELRESGVDLVPLWCIHVDIDIHIHYFREGNHTHTHTQSNTFSLEDNKMLWCVCVCLFVTLEDED